MKKQKELHRLTKELVKQMTGNEVDDTQDTNYQISYYYLSKAMDYTRCCNKLRFEEKLTFSKWLEYNKYEYIHNNLYRKESNKLLTHVDLLGKEYIKYFNL